MKSDKCKGCTRVCTEKCMYHADYWKASAQQTAEFLIERFEPRACDCEAVSHCERCSVVFIARRMLDITNSVAKQQCQSCGNAIITKKEGKGMPTIICGIDQRVGWDRTREWGDTCNEWVPTNKNREKTQ